MSCSMPSLCSVVRSKKALLPFSPPTTGWGQGCSNSNLLSGSRKDTSVTAPLTFISRTRRMAMAHRCCSNISTPFASNTSCGGVGMVTTRRSLSKSTILSIPSLGKSWVWRCGMSPQSTAPSSPTMRVGASSVPLSSGRMNSGCAMWCLPALTMMRMPPPHLGSPVRRHSLACRNASCKLSSGPTRMSPADCALQQGLATDKRNNMKATFKYILILRIPLK